MPAASRYTIENLSRQVEKRDSVGDNTADDSNGEGPVAIVGLVVAALTLLVAITSLRSSRFRRWVSCLLPSHFVKVYSPLLALFRRVLHIYSESHNPAQIAPDITPPNGVPANVSTTENLSTVPTENISMPGAVFIYNDYSNTHPAGTHPNTFPYGRYGITREDGSVPQVEEPLHPRGVEPAVAGQFP
ncbi:hypothetical protein HOY82DRAFT_599457 [Tuber indicum]|nr:hypothetical protein HOY82DRAFT_599457 [Tuber indicum]